MTLVVCLTYFSSILSSSNKAVAKFSIEIMSSSIIFLLLSLFLFCKRGTAPTVPFFNGLKVERSDGTSSVY